MVGVPFFDRCDCGPSSRIGWPLPCRMRNMAIVQGPKKKTKSNPVEIAPPVRKVMYRNTFRISTCSLNRLSQ